VTPDHSVPIRAGLLTAHLTRAGGGVFTAVHAFAQNLAAQPGLDIQVFGPVSPSDDLSPWRPLPIHTAPISGPRSFAYAPALDKTIAGHDPALLHLHGLWMHPSVAALAFTRRTRKPHLISPHGMLDPWALRNSAFKKTIATLFFERRNINTAACLHALNDAEARAIRACGFNGPIATIPNGIHLPDAANPPPLPPWSRNDPTLKTLLYLGRLHPKKGLPGLLAAWSRLDPALRIGWRLVIAGWDQHAHQRDLQRIAAGLHIEGSVHFPGPLFGQDKLSALHHSHAFILPSLSEGQPMAILEAWSHAKPVLMTPQCNLPEGFAANAAISIDPDDQSILQGLTQLITIDETARHQIGANGYTLVKNNFSWPKIAAQMSALYRWLADRAPQPTSVITP
jgi:glycosyltransferase involved in cell wall biosynthesis